MSVVCPYRQALAVMMGIEIHRCHIGLFNLDQCAAVIHAVYALRAVRGYKGKQE